MDINYLYSKEYITVEEALHNGLIPDDFSFVFKGRYSCICGSPLVINYARTTIACSDPQCINTLGGRLLTIYKFLNDTVTSEDPYLNQALGMGQISVVDYLQTNGITTLKEGILNPPKWVESTAWLKAKHTAGTILSFINIPGLGDSTCNTLMSSFKNFEHMKFLMFYKGMSSVYEKFHLKCDFKILMTQLVELYRKYPAYLNKALVTCLSPVLDGSCSEDKYLFEVMMLGLEQLCQYIFSGSGKQADKVFLTIKTYWRDIEDIFSMTNCVTQTGETIRFNVTGDITQVVLNDSFPSRPVFIDYVKQLGLEHGKILSFTSGIVKVDYIVNDIPSSSRKYQAGLASGKLISSKDFISKIINDGGDDDDI